MIDIKRLRIVIADDHIFLLNGLNDHLNRLGLNVIGMAHDGAQALQLITDEQPDLAILDVEMPYMSGFTVADICRTKGMSTKIVVLSLHRELGFVKEAKSLGIKGYVLKEDSTSEILTCIEEVAQDR
ncbi:MAG: response regulator, partial [Marinoscillum sp.]